MEVLCMVLMDLSDNQYLSVPNTYGYRCLKMGLVCCEKNSKKVPPRGDQAHATLQVQ